MGLVSLPLTLWKQTLSFQAKRKKNDTETTKSGRPFLPLSRLSSTFLRIYTQASSAPSKATRGSKISPQMNSEKGPWQRWTSEVMEKTVLGTMNRPKQTCASILPHSKSFWYVSLPVNKCYPWVSWARAIPYFRSSVLSDSLQCSSHVAGILWRFLTSGFHTVSKRKH